MYDLAHLHCLFAKMFFKFNQNFIGHTLVKDGVLDLLYHERFDVIAIDFTVSTDLSCPACLIVAAIGDGRRFIAFGFLAVSSVGVSAFPAEYFTCQQILLVMFLSTAIVFTTSITDCIVVITTLRADRYVVSMLMSRLCVVLMDITLAIIALYEIAIPTILANVDGVSVAIDCIRHIVTAEIFTTFIALPIIVVTTVTANIIAIADFLDTAFVVFFAAIAVTVIMNNLMLKAINAPKL